MKLGLFGIILVVILMTGEMINPKKQTINPK